MIFLFYKKLQSNKICQNPLYEKFMQKHQVAVK